MIDGVMIGRLFILFPLALAAQTTTGTLNLYPPDSATEQVELNQAINEANNSPIDLTRGLEQHLSKYPNSPQRSAIEAQLYKTAAEGNDGPRIILYGEKLLAANPTDELGILDRVTRALVAIDDPESQRQALVYARRHQASVAAFRARPPEGHTTAAQWADLADRALARGLIVEARAAGNLGNAEDAVAAARRSWDALPSAEAAHEMARWLVKLGREAEALDHYADAVTINDPRALWDDRDADRKTASALYVKLHGSEEGLGDLFLHGWNRAAAALTARVARYKAIDRNYNLTDMFQFVLPSLDAKAKGPTMAALNSAALDMATLKGKTLVMDFWATWCGPCIAQQPLIEHVMQKYAKDADVVLLSLNADDDRSLIAPFLKAQKWNQRVYPEAGLAGLLSVTSLPTILVIDPAGKIHSRMPGYSPDIFERMLSARIDEARAARTH